LKKHKKYLKDLGKKLETQADKQEAHAKSRKYYENKISSLTEKAGREEKNHKTDNSKLMKENESLLFQYNYLIRDVHARKLGGGDATVSMGGTRRSRLDSEGGKRAPTAEGGKERSCSPGAGNRGTHSGAGKFGRREQKTEKCQRTPSEIGFPLRKRKRRLRERLNSLASRKENRRRRMMRRA